MIRISLPMNFDLEKGYLVKRDRIEGYSEK